MLKLSIAVVALAFAPATFGLEPCGDRVVWPESLFFKRAGYSRMILSDC